MPTSRHSKRWIWTGRIVSGLVVVGLIVYFAIVGLDNADKLGSVIACLFALAALVAPYLFPVTQRPVDQGSDTGTPPFRWSTHQAPGIDARHAQGVQINQGGNNTQNNNFGPV